MRCSKVLEVPVGSAAGGAPGMDDVSGAGGMSDHVETVSEGQAGRLVGGAADLLPVMPAGAVVVPPLKDGCAVSPVGEDPELPVVGHRRGRTGDGSAEVFEAPVEPVTGHAHGVHEVAGAGCAGKDVELAGIRCHYGRGRGGQCVRLCAESAPGAVGLCAESAPAAAVHLPDVVRNAIDTDDKAIKPTVGVVRHGRYRADGPAKVVPSTPAASDAHLPDMVERVATVEHENLEAAVRIGRDDWVGLHLPAAYLVPAPQVHPAHPCAM